jgi:hypothetical protein
MILFFILPSSSSPITVIIIPIIATVPILHDQLLVDQKVRSITIVIIIHIVVNSSIVILSIQIFLLMLSREWGNDP